MDQLTSFIDTILSYNIEIPLWFKTGLIIFIIGAFIVAAYLFYDTFNTTYMRDGFIWFVIIGIVNLLTILIIYFYYNKKPADFKGPIGPRGKKGRRGKVGVSVSCGYCKNNLYIQSVRKADTICTLNSRHPLTNAINTKLNYFLEQTELKNNIDYASFISNIVLAKPTATDNQSIINKFRRLLNPVILTIALVNEVSSQFITVSNRNFGTFRSPVAKVGYIPLGDSAYGGTETFTLNSFCVSGDIMYPAGFQKLVSFPSYNETTGDIDIYTIWRPQPQTVNNTTFDGSTERHAYLSLGDICRFGTANPSVNDCAIIKDTCLEPVNPTDLKMVFIYTGSLEIVEDISTITDVDIISSIITRTTSPQLIETFNTQNNSYLITDETPQIPPNNIQIFSVWRTPMNTFITNSNITNTFANDTVYGNMIGGGEDMVDAGEIRFVGENGEDMNPKMYVREKIAGIRIPQIIAAMIYTKHFLIENTRELNYYINRFRARIPEFADIELDNMTLAEMMELVRLTNQEYEDWNADLIRTASLDLSSKTGTTYDESLELHLPPKLLQTYANINNNLDTIPIMIENTETLLDIVNNIIPNGLDGRVAVDSNGIAEGGIMLNEIQETVLRVCKVLMPPVAIMAYTIKDECLGTFEMDRERERLIAELTKLKNIYNKNVDILSNNYEKYKSQAQYFRQQDDNSLRKIGQIIGHIPNYMDKLHNMNLDDITESRIKGLITVYKEANSNMEKIINSVE